MSTGSPRSRPGPADRATTGAGTPAPGSSPDLRSEHDGIAERLAVRRSIDLIRRGAYTAFVGLLAAGMAGKLGYDQWLSTRATRFRGPPVLCYSALAVALVLLSIAAWTFLRARRHMREEDAQFARLRSLRERLGLDP